MRISGDLSGIAVHDPNYFEIMRDDKLGVI